MADDCKEFLIAGSVIQHNEGIAVTDALRQTKEATVCVEGILFADVYCGGRLSTKDKTHIAACLVQFRRQAFAAFRRNAAGRN